MKNLFIISLVVLCLSKNGLATQRSVTVQGQCHREVTPDRGMIRATVDRLEKELKDSTRKAFEQYERLRESVKKLNLENVEIKTSEYNVFEVKEWEKDRSIFKGFRTRLGLEVSSTSIQRLGEVIVLAAREEIKEVGGLSVYLSTEKRRKEEALCLEIAAQDAKQRAEKLALAVGAQLGEVIEITEQGLGDVSYPIRPMRGMKEGMAASLAIETPQIESGKEEILFKVRGSFYLK